MLMIMIIIMFLMMMHSFRLCFFWLSSLLMLLNYKLIDTTIIIFINLWMRVIWCSINVLLVVARHWWRVLSIAALCKVWKYDWWKGVLLPQSKAKWSSWPTLNLKAVEYISSMLLEWSDMTDGNGSPLVFAIGIQKAQNKFILFNSQSDCYRIWWICKTSHHYRNSRILLTLWLTLKWSCGCVAAVSDISCSSWWWK